MPPATSPVAASSQFVDKNKKWRHILFQCHLKNCQGSKVWRVLALVLASRCQGQYQGLVAPRPRPAQECEQSR